MKKMFLAAFITLCGVSFANASCVENCRNNFPMIDDCAKACYEEVAKPPKSAEELELLGEQKILSDPHIERLGPSLK